MGLRRPNQGFKLCPHCGGETRCRCATCGTETTTRARGAGARWMEAGMCKACNGQGQVHDPDYRPPMPESSQTSTGCAIAAIALLLPVLLAVAGFSYTFLV